MTDKQPNALRLADTVLKLRSHLGPWRDESDPDEQAAWDSYTEAAAELRHLQVLCDEMGEALVALLEDTQHKEHTVCSDKCPVMNARAALAKWKESK